MALALLFRQLLPNLKQLELDVVGFSSQLLAPLCAGTAPIKLQELCIRECKVDSQLLPTLGQLQHLRVLHLGCSYLFGGEHDVSPLAQLKGLQKLSLSRMEPVGLSSVLSACTQLRALKVPYAHHITPELCSRSLTEISVTDIIMSKPFLLDVGRLPSLRALHVVYISLCEDEEQGRLPQSGDIVEQNSRMLSTLPAAVEVGFGFKGKSELWLRGFPEGASEQKDGDVVQALLGRLKPLATLPAARELRELLVDYVQILPAGFGMLECCRAPGSIPALAFLFPGLRDLQFGTGDSGLCNLSPEGARALFVACACFSCLHILSFDFEMWVALTILSVVMYELGRRQVSGGLVLVFVVGLPDKVSDRGERAVFEGLQEHLLTLSKDLPAHKQWVRVMEDRPSLSARPGGQVGVR